MPPGSTGAEVEDYEACAAFVAAVYYVADSCAGGGGVKAEVEAEVVHVGVWVVDCGGKV